MRDLERSKAERERFQAEDQPRYTKWLNANFGALLTEMRELQEKVYNAQGLVSEVQEEFYYGEYQSIAEAYVKVLRRREHPEEFKAEWKEREEEEKEMESEFKESIKDVFKHLFGDEAAELAEKLFPGADSEGEPPDSWAPEPSHRNGPETGRLKELYRSLARKLHPDMGGNGSARHIEWWHQTQAAYQAGDVEQLQLILTLAEIEEKGSNEASVSILQRITDQFKRGLSALKSELKKYRKDPAWNFSRLEDFRPIEARTRAGLMNERQRLNAMFTRFQHQIDSWEKLRGRVEGGSRARRKGGRGKKRADYSQMEMEGWME